MELVIKLLVNTVAVLMGAYLLRGVEVKGFGHALITAILLAIAHAFIKPILVFLGLPLIPLTFGLILLVINGLIVWIVSGLSSGFQVRNFGTAILFSVVLSLINMVLFWLV